MLLDHIYIIVAYHSAVACGRGTPYLYNGVIKLNEKFYSYGENFFGFVQNFLKILLGFLDQPQCFLNILFLKNFGNIPQIFSIVS